MEQLHFLNHRPAPHVQAQPEVELCHWRILQRGNGTLHIVAKVGDWTYRVTSALIAMDLPRGIAKTESGRGYHLSAPPEEDKFLREVMVINGIRDLVVISADLSDAVWRAASLGAWPKHETRLLPPWQ